MSGYSISRMVVAGCGLALAHHALADEVTRFNFDDRVEGGRNLSFVTAPDLRFTVGQSGTFPGSVDDLWGTVSDHVNDQVLDDSVADPTDVFGLLGTTHVGRVFAAEDLENPDNPSAQATATWTFDVSGFSGLLVSVDAAAMGNFDKFSCPLPPCLWDRYDFTASMDGGPEFPLFTSDVLENTTLVYTLQSGVQVPLNDPLALNGVTLRNTFQTISTAISATGSTLTIILRGQGDATEEVVLFDNIVIQGTPGPVCDTIDFNHDTLFPDTQDIDDFLVVFSGGLCSNDPNCGDIDFNNDTLFPDTSDIDSLLRVFSGGSCF